jgi:hypothetical protein
VQLDTSTNALLAPDGFGARVETTAGGITRMRIMNGAPSYLTTSELMVHFGLGDATAVDELRVHWPRGQVTALADLATDQRLTIVAPVPGDLNADGSIGTADLLVLLAAWGPASAPPQLAADLNGDGVVSTPDLLALLTEWG